MRTARCRAVAAVATGGIIDAVLPIALSAPTPFARLGNIIPLTLGFLLLIAAIALGREPPLQGSI